MMFQKIFQFIRKNQMIEAGDEVLVGVSGGADSVCLFFLLQNLQQQIPFHLTVMHINHSLRETAQRDEDFVRDLCKTYHVDFVKQKIDVPHLVKEQGLSVEEGARLARYEAFAKQAQRLQNSTGAPVKLAVAHHINDQAETVLFHLFRGCSVAGLRGMLPVRKEEFFTVIRPLLDVTREEIEAFLEKQGILFMTDETNMDNQYSRNRIRNEMLPMAEQFICQGTVSHIAKTAKDVTMVQDFLDTICQKEYASVVSERNEVVQISCNDFLQLHGYLQYEILYRAISQIAGVKKDLSRVHIEALFKLFDSQVGRQIDLPYGIGARKTYEWVELYKKDREKDVAFSKTKEELPLEIPGTTCLTQEMQIEARVFPFDNTHEIPKKKYTKWFDYDKIEKSLTVRNRQKDDYFYIDASHKKRVKDYMVNEKIDQAIRDELLMICEGNHMVWMPGYRISAYYKVNQETKRVLELAYVGGTKDGRDS